MNINQIIEELENLRDKHGDLDVSIRYFNNEDGIFELKEVDDVAFFIDILEDERKVVLTY